jgi:hypothetical protein
MVEPPAVPFPSRESSVTLARQPYGSDIGGLLRVRFQLNLRMVTLLTEQEVARSWLGLFKDKGIDGQVLDQAEMLLKELRPESPLRHRLDAELAELRQRAV